MGSPLGGKSPYRPLPWTGSFKKRYALLDALVEMDDVLPSFLDWLSPWSCFYRPEGLELYRLSEDPLEKHNLIAEYPEVAREMHRERGYRGKGKQLFRRNTSGQALPYYWIRILH